MYYEVGVAPRMYYQVGVATHKSTCSYRISSSSNTDPLMPLVPTDKWVWLYISHTDSKAYS